MEELKPYDVAVAPELVDQIQDCLKQLEMAPVQVIFIYLMFDFD